jgi:hypothetical protein
MICDFDTKLGKKDTQMKIIQTYGWENLLNTIIELCGRLKKGLSNMLINMNHPKYIDTTLTS